MTRSLECTSWAFLTMMYGKVFKIGVNFDSKTRSIGDWKVVEG